MEGIDFTNADQVARKIDEKCEEGEFYIATEIAKEFFTVSPRSNYPHICMTYASCLSILKKHDEALELYEIAVNSQDIPEYAYAAMYCNIGHMYLDKGELSKALNSYEKSCLLGEAAALMSFAQNCGPNMFKDLMNKIDKDKWPNLYAFGEAIYKELIEGDVEGAAEKMGELIKNLKSEDVEDKHMMTIIEEYIQDIISRNNDE